MSAARIQAVKKQGCQLFDKRFNLLNHWQDVAINFYPQRADFTTYRAIGEELMRDLMTSKPVIASRDMCNTFGTMLRPSQTEWFNIGTNQEGREDTQAKQWLEWATGVQKRAMYDRASLFTRATKEGDFDFGNFGQTCISVDMNRYGNGILYRCWHLRDVAWAENEEGQVDTVYRKWKPTAITLKRIFGDKIHANVARKLEKEPYCEINVWHVVIPTDVYMNMPGASKIRQPYVSIWLDVDNDHEMEVVGSWSKMYVIPRWQTVSGSQYAYSPAAVAGIADARTIQAMTRVLLEAGEKAVTPPMVAVQEMIRSDVNVYAGGITWVDSDYDERMGEVLRPITNDKNGIPIGMEMQRDIYFDIKEAFFLNKLSMPPQGGPEMTAYEVGQRVQEYIRNAMPLFEPMEADYNGQLCEVTFELLLRNGAFGRPDSIPRSIQGADIQFTFESPLREASNKAKANQYLEASQVLAQAVAVDPTVQYIMDSRKAVRDVLQAIAPAAWMRLEAEVDEMIEQEQATQEAAQALALMQQGADVASTLSGTEVAA